MLCLKRFGTGRFGKINKVLVYGEKLDLGPFMAAGAMDDGPATYTLTGVVVHLDQVMLGGVGWGGVRSNWVVEWKGLVGMRCCSVGYGLGVGWRLPWVF